MTTLNGCRMIRQFTQEDVESGRFDPLAVFEAHTVECDTPETKKTVLVRERGYVPAELIRLFRVAGFEIEHIGGGTAGNWGRRQLELDEMEVMIIAQKTTDIVS